MTKVIIVTLIILTMSIWGHSAPAIAKKADKNGSSDHPLVSRFDGFVIDAYKETQFDRYELPLGPSASGTSYAEMMTLEGKVTRIFYVYDGATAPSLFQLYTSYENAFKADGVEILYTCFKLDCGAGPTDLVKAAANRKILLNGFMGFGDHAYHAVKFSSDDKDVFVGVFLKDERGNVQYELHFVEVQTMNEGNIALGDIEKGIEQTGKQAFYGLYFDTGKATLKDTALDELTLLADYLAANKNKSFFIVGHTDNVGSYESNLGLSLQRATSVINALQEQYDLDVSNLEAIGVGPVSPVTANATREGKAQNRRVELVLR